MPHFTGEQVGSVWLPGRTIQSAVGRNAFSDSSTPPVGFAHHSAESGPVEPHQHVEEVMHALDADHGWTRFGPAASQLEERIPSAPETVLHSPPLE